MTETAPLTREDAERICRAHGWLADSTDPTPIGRSPHMWWVLNGTRGCWLPSWVLRALDPDRPPSLAALRRLLRGMYIRAADSPRYTGQGLDDIALTAQDRDAEALLACAWAFGADEEE